MERKSPYLKVAAVLSAALLVGAFVSYRAGAFERYTHPDPPLLGAALPDPTELQPAPLTDEQLTLMSSSKSFTVFTPTKPAPQPAAPESPPAYMGGSKFKVIFSPDPPKPAAPNEPKP